MAKGKPYSQQQTGSHPGERDAPLGKVKEMMRQESQKIMAGSAASLPCPEWNSSSLNGSGSSVPALGWG